jgi:hypothetical protein
MLLRSTAQHSLLGWHKKLHQQQQQQQQLV